MAQQLQLLIWESEVTPAGEGRAVVVARKPLYRMTRAEAARLLGCSEWTVSRSTPFLPVSEPHFSPSCAPTRKSNFLAIRVLEVRSTETCLQLYTSSHFDQPITGKLGNTYTRFGALCLECQGYPDAVNTPGFGDILVHPGQPQRHTTVYAFST